MSSPKMSMASVDIQRLEQAAWFPCENVTERLQVTRHGLCIVCQSIHELEPPHRKSGPGSFLRQSGPLKVVACF